MGEAKKEVFLTADGLKKLEDELENLKTNRRREIADRIKQAIEFGDISENSEYEDAKNEQAFIEGSIMDLEKKLRNVVIIDSKSKDDMNISVGTTIVLRDIEFNEDAEYTIVGSMEADPLAQKISNESPVGSALLGKTIGDMVKVPTPSGETIEYKVLEIK